MTFEKRIFKASITLCVFLTLPKVLFSQAPLVKMATAENDSVFKVRENDIEKHPPSMIEIKAQRIESRKSLIGERLRIISDSSQKSEISDADFNRLHAEEISLNKSIIEMQKSIDGLQDTITPMLIDNYVNYLKTDRTCGAIFFPASPVHFDSATSTSALYFNSRYKRVRSLAFYKFIYSAGSNWGALNSVAIQAQGNQASLYAEIGSGLIGPVRFGLSTQVAKSDTIKVDEARHRLKNGGGNVNFEGQFPLLFLYKPWSCTYIYTSVRFSGDVAAFGSNTDDATGSVNMGFEFYQDFSTSNKEFNMYTSIRFSWINGFNKLYYANLGLDQIPGMFPYGQMAVGITMFSNYRFSIIVPIYGPAGSILKVPANFGGQVMPVIAQ